MMVNTSSLNLCLELMSRMKASRLHNLSIDQGQLAATTDVPRPSLPRQYSALRRQNGRQQQVPALHRTPTETDGISVYLGLRQSMISWIREPLHPSRGGPPGSTPGPPSPKPGSPSSRPQGPLGLRLHSPRTEKGFKPTVWTILWIVGHTSHLHQRRLTLQTGQKMSAGRMEWRSEG